MAAKRRRVDLDGDGITEILTTVESDESDVSDSEVSFDFGYEPSETSSVHSSEDEVEEEDDEDDADTPATAATGGRRPRPTPRRQRRHVNQRDWNEQVFVPKVFDFDTTNSGASPNLGLDAESREIDFF